MTHELRNMIHVFLELLIHKVTLAHPLIWSIINTKAKIAENLLKDLNAIGPHEVIVQNEIDNTIYEISRLSFDLKYFKGLIVNKRFQYIKKYVN